MNPSLDEIQTAINHCALEIIRSTQGIASWKLVSAVDHHDTQCVTTSDSSSVIELFSQLSGDKTIYSRVTNDIEMVKNVLILAGAVQNLRNRVCAFMVFLIVYFDILPDLRVSRYFYLF
jgi:hypothetical protein